MTKLEAQAIYRGAWAEYTLAHEDKRKRELESIMDGVQDACVTRNEKPCMGSWDHNPAMEEWKAFAATMPGYVEFWDMADEEFEELRVLLEERLNSES